MQTEDSEPKAALWKTILWVAYCYVLFVAVACVMTVVGLILMPVGLIGYIFTIPFRRRSSAGAG